MRRVVWSDDALNDLDDIIAFVSDANPTAADAILDRIEAAIDMLSEVPAGRMGRVAGTHEWHVQRTPYIVAYSLADMSLNVLRVIHGARDWQQDEWPAE